MGDTGLPKRQITVFSSSARGSSENSSDFLAKSRKGVRLYLDITAASGSSPTLDLKLQGLDAESGSYFDLAGAAFAQQTGTGSVMLTIYPGIAETANVSVSYYLPETWRVMATIGGSTPSFTFSIGADLLA